MDGVDRAVAVAKNPSRLARTGAAEGGAAALGLATLSAALLRRGLVDANTLKDMRDEMLEGLDPSDRPGDLGLEQAHRNVQRYFGFLDEPR